MNKWIFISLVCLIGCTEEIKTLPIDEEKLGKILIDVHVAEAALQPLVGYKKDSLREIYYQQIFEIHEVDQSSFEESVNILSEDPRRLRFFYEDLIDEVEKVKSNKTPKRKTRTFSKSNRDSLSQE